MSEINRKRAIDALEAVVPHLADDWSAETDAELVEAVRLSLAVQSDYSPDGWSPTHWSPEYFAGHEADDLPPANHPAAARSGGSGKVSDIVDKIDGVLWSFLVDSARDQPGYGHEQVVMIIWKIAN